MEVVNKKLVLVVIMIGIVCAFFIWQNISDKETKLEIVSLNKETKSSNMFAIMLEEIDEEGNSVYVESTDNKWPSSDEYLYNEIQSGCMDVNGNKLVDALVYDAENNIASVETSNTSYCYLYFKIRPTAYGTILEGEENISVPIIGGMYRYQGTYDVVNNNYICFGTSDESECLSDTDKYMYRIIGITQDNQLKLIKKEALESGYKWNSNASSNILWPNSELNNSLNGTAFLTNEEKIYITNEWKQKIADTIWEYGDISHAEFDSIENGIKMYYLEKAFGDSEDENYNIETDGQTTSLKIGLMYIHDYYLAYSNQSNCSENYGNYNLCKESWIHISQNDLDGPSNKEWLMTRLGDYGSIYRAWSIYDAGFVTWYDPVKLVNSVRPVFYTIPLSSINGEGTLVSPFFIEL